LPGMLFLSMLVVAAMTVVLLWRVGEVRGKVVTTGGKPVNGATVRVKATEFQAVTDSQGRFVLNGFPSRFGITITAWADGYYIRGTVARPWRREVTVSIEPYRTGDNPSYSWVPPKVEGRSAAENLLIRASLPIAAFLSFNKMFLPLSARFTLGCADCHGATIYGQYSSSAHARGTSNIKL